MCFLGLLAVALVAGCGSTKPAGSGKKADRTLRAGPLRQAIIADAKEWIGTPYRAGGSDREGTDCSGMVWSVFADHGRKLPRSAKEMFREGKAVYASTISPGDLVFFKNTAGPGITHVGIYLGLLEFIHSSTRKGVIISRLDDQYYRRHYAGARRVID